ncbi:GGDEF domain-containing protein [Psychromonas sp. MME2]|uniref:GGDEF domain-containing protein n=1 Tax=unclassified Psychromonas TaxID=2614957 RepID=UPI00339C267D
MFPDDLCIKLKKTKDIKTLFLIDILHMKDINASYGFGNGNAVLKQFKEFIKSLLKKEISEVINKAYGKKITSRVTRHHSDVFALIIYENLHDNLILTIKDIINTALLSYSFDISKPNLKINLNTTIGCSKSHCNDLFIFAEKALSGAKLNFEMFMFFDADLYKNETSNNSLVELIKYNIENETVAPYFQAMLCNTTDEIVKYEALMRLFDEQGNMLSPGVFLEKAKTYRLYTPLMIIMIKKVFDIIVKYKIHCSINLEYTDIINPLISNLITTQIQQHNIGNYLNLEILESERIKNFDVINDFIRTVKEHGATIAIDDFGTGFANYEYILKLNVDYLKIDGSLIQKIDEDIYMNLIKSIVMFCNKQNIKTIAEYVSNIKIQRYVKSLGINYSQGYYIQKPLSIEQLKGEKCEG